MVNSAAIHSSETNSLEIYSLELKSHANMPVAGRGAYIVAHSGKTVDVQAYNPHSESKQIPIVDTTLQYDITYDGKTYMLVIRNALHVPSMNNHLIPPFLMREAGIIV